MDNLAAFSNAAGTGEGLSIAEIYARQARLSVV